MNNEWSKTYKYTPPDWRYQSDAIFRNAVDILRAFLLCRLIRSAGLGGASGLNVARRHGLVAHFPEQLFRCLNELVALRQLRHPRSDLA